MFWSVDEISFVLLTIIWNASLMDCIHVRYVCKIYIIFQVFSGLHKSHLCFRLEMKQLFVHFILKGKTLNGPPLRKPWRQRLCPLFSNGQKRSLQGDPLFGIVMNQRNRNLILGEKLHLLKMLKILLGNNQFLVLGLKISLQENHLCIFGYHYKLIFILHVCKLVI